MISSSAGLQAVSFVINVILARILLPADFGAVAIVLGITGILQTFAELGTSVALVQRKDISKSVIDSAFSSTFAVTVIIVGFLWLSSGYIADFFALSVINGMIKIAAVAYFFRGLFAIYHCILLREMRYKEISFIDFCGYFVYGSVSVICAIKGYGPFSMVWGQLFWTIALLMMGIWRTKYFPKSLGRFSEIKELLSFGIWVSAGRVLRNSAGKLDNFIIGKLLGAAPLGAYSIAQRTVMVLPRAFSSVIDQVMLPIYSQWQDDLPRLERGYWQVLSYSSLLMIIPVFLMVILAEPLVSIVFGAKWLSVIPLIKIISVFSLVRIMGDGVTDSVVFAVGQPQMITIMNVFRVFVMPVCLFIGSAWGVSGVAWGLAVSGIVGRLFNQWLLKKMIGISFLKYFKEMLPLLFYALIGYLVAVILINKLGPYIHLQGIILYCVEGIVWLLIYLGCVRIFSSDRWFFLVKQLDVNVISRLKRRLAV